MPVLVEALSDQWVRYAAVESLGMLKAKEAVPNLLRVYHEDEWVRPAVIEALGDIGDPEQIDFLICEMAGKDEMIRQACLNAVAKTERREPTGVFERLEKVGLDVDSIVADGLSRSDPEVRTSPSGLWGSWGANVIYRSSWSSSAILTMRSGMAAHEALVRLGRRHLDALLGEYGNQGESLQKELIEVLGKIGDARAVPEIVEALEKGSDPVREAAARTLAVFNDRSAVDPLIRHLADPSGPVRSGSASSLGVLRAVRATRELMGVLEDPHDEARESASEALGRIGTSEVIRHVSVLLKHRRSEVRQAAIQCLGLVLDKRAESHLIDALNNSDRGVRRFAANMLGKRKATKAVRPLLMALLDEDWQVRKCAGSTLGNIRDPRSTGALLDSLKDEKPVGALLDRNRPGEDGGTISNTRTDRVPSQ